jgi:sporulation protein YlmC with PRC-barrel domain
MASDISRDDIEIVIVDVEAVAEGYRVSELMGSNVINDRDEKIGSIDDLIVSTDDCVLFAVLQVGGFLGLGGHLVAVPYDSLELERDDGKTRIILPGASRDALEKLPEFRYES